MVGHTGTRVAGWTMAGGTVTFLLGVSLLALNGFPSALKLSANWPWSSHGILLAGGGGLIALGALSGLVGLALYVLIPAFSSRERACQDYGSHRVVLACTLLSAAAGNLLAALYFIPAAFLLPQGSLAGVARQESAVGLLSPEGIVVAALSLDVALLAIVYLRVLRPRAIAWSALGLSRQHLLGKIVLGLLFGMLLFVLSSLLEFLLEGVGIHQTQNELFQSVGRASPKQFGLVLLAGAVMAPLVEEIYFRGFVFRAYLDQKGLWQAFLFSSALFAAVHLDLAALVPIFSMGLLLSFLYYRTGSLVPAIVAHSFNNAVAFTLFYLGLS